MEQAATLSELDALLAQFQEDAEGIPEALTLDGGALLRRTIVSCDDASPEVRKKACWVLGNWLDRRRSSDERDLAEAASAAIVRLLHGDSKYEVRLAAVFFSQGLLPSPVPYLVQATRDRSQTVRYYVTFALSCFMPRWFQGEREQYRLPVAQALVKLLGDRDEQVREEAALGLGNHDWPFVRERLKQALEDPDAHVRGAAAVTLVRFRDPGAPEAVRRLLQADQLGPHLFRAVQRLGDPTLLPWVREASERYRREWDAADGPLAPYDIQAIQSLEALLEPGDVG